MLLIPFETWNSATLYQECAFRGQLSQIYCITVTITVVPHFKVTPSQDKDIFLIMKIGDLCPIETNRRPPLLCGQNLFEYNVV